MTETASTRRMLPPLAARESAAATQPPRTLVVTRDLTYTGGVPRFALYLARGRRAGQFQMQLATLADPEAQMVSAFREAEVTVHACGDAGYLRPAQRLRRLLDRQRIDLLVACSFKAYLVAKLAALGTRCRVIYWVHSVTAIMQGPIRTQIFRRWSRHETLVFASQAVRSAHLPPSHRGPDAVIYNGVEDVSARPEYAPYPHSRRGDLGLPADALVLGYTAEFVPHKDHATLLRAFDHLARERANLHLLLIGDGLTRQAVERQAASLASAPRIHLLGRRPDARRLLGLMDVYVHPGQTEAFGLAVVEAMLAGKPVVAVRSGAFPEYIDDRVTGRLFVPGDPTDLARQLEAVLADTDAAARMAGQARAMCLRRFTPERLAAEVDGLLRSAQVSP